MTKEIINQFKDYVIKNKLTQSEAAAKIGCTQEHLSRIFTGIRNPSIKILDKMEEVIKEE